MTVIESNERDTPMSETVVVVDLYLLRVDYDTLSEGFDIYAAEVGGITYQ